ncbi:hypothetical protein J1N35_014095 [Gossypium stocksii]|uniref:Uncharacterized protein n=1 Tax=Gossypium stocksii TaxID=47602 RepID=A0A9D4A8Z2_9ROSI|nr:hypothetical protein J1N35_014095 [Gossypium stocksii]
MSSRDKRTVATASKKCKGPGGSSSSRPTAESRHSFITFPQNSQEDLFQMLRAHPLGAGHCIDWLALERVQLADAIRALLSIDPWGQFFNIIEPTYLELTLEFCSTFHLQVVMTNHDDPGTIQFRLGGLVHQLSVPKFGIALGFYTDEFIADEGFSTFPHRIHITQSTVGAISP